MEGAEPFPRPASAATAVRTEEAKMKGSKGRNVMRGGRRGRVFFGFRSPVSGARPADCPRKMRVKRGHVSLIASARMVGASHNPERRMTVRGTAVILGPMLPRCGFPPKPLFSTIGAYRTPGRDRIHPSFWVMTASYLLRGRSGAVGRQGATANSAARRSLPAV